MHSSRMRTVRNSSRLLGGGSGLVLGGTASSGVWSGPGWVCWREGWSGWRGSGLVPGGCLFLGGLVWSGRSACSREDGIPACIEADPPSVDRQAGVKTYIFRNFIADGKKNLTCEIRNGNIQRKLYIKWYCILMINNLMAKIDLLFSYLS